MRIDEKVYKAMPANLQALFTIEPNPARDEVLAAFPQAPGQIADASSSSSRAGQNVYGAMKCGNGRDGEASADSDNEGGVGFKMKPGARRIDTGSAARFFYCAKADRADRNEGLDDPGAQFKAGRLPHDAEAVEKGKRGNHHPTVKPTDLMRYLCRLVTPPGGMVLDPFAGSGSTLKAAELEGFSAIGIELSAEYVALAMRRVSADAPLFSDVQVTYGSTADSPPIPQSNGTTCKDFSSSPARETLSNGEG